MTFENELTIDATQHHVNSKLNGYFVSGKNNSQLVRDQLDILKFHRYEILPKGGVKFNWITRIADIDWKTFDSNFQILNHIHNEGQLSNKGLLVTNLRNYEINLVRNKIHYSLPLKTFVPETYLLDNLPDRMNFKRAFKDDSLWICKPVGLSCGREIFLFRHEDQLENLLNEYHKKTQYCSLYYNRLVQKYIENPLLINKHKFDIRTYLLCICTANEILCFAAQTGYLRLSMYEYDSENLNKFIHLTNQRIQIKDKNFQSIRNNTGMTMEEFNEYFNQYVQPNNKDWVLKELPQKMTKILNQVANSVRNKLSMYEGCFGYYGVDILIDDKLNCWLLEINSGPTLDMTNVALEKVIPLCLNAAINIVIESLDNYRSFGSALPLRESNLFKYLPPSDHCTTSSIMPYYMSVFNTVNGRRIDLTPGVLVSYHRYRRLTTRKIKSKQKKVVSIPKNDKKLPSTPIISERRQSIVRNLSTKMSREHLSHQLTKLIQTNNEQLVLNNKLNQKHSTVSSTREWILPQIDRNQFQWMPISTNYMRNDEAK